MKLRLKYLVCAAASALFLPCAQAYKIAPCPKKEYLVEERVRKVQKLLKNTPDSSGLKSDLAKLYMVGSVHEKFVFCGRLGGNEKEWGAFVFRPFDEYSPIITWDGEVKNKEYLELARAKIEDLHSEVKKSDWPTMMLYAWVLEKQGELDRALYLYESVYETQAERMKNNLLCKPNNVAGFVCEPLNAVLESLERMILLLESLGDKSKAKEWYELRRSYFWKVPQLYWLRVEFLVAKFFGKLSILLGFTSISFITSVLGRKNRGNKIKFHEEGLLWPF